MEIIKNETDYALRALAHLAAHRMLGNEAPVAAKTLAAAEGIPEDFAYKILQRLARAGLTEGQMGPQGGFRLALDPGEVTLLRVIEAMQGPVTIRRCLLSEDMCSRRQSCPVSARLEGIKDDLVRSLHSVTLADVLLARRPPGAGETSNPEQEVSNEQ